MNILLTSEDDDLLYVLCYGLRHHGYEVISVAPSEQMSQLLQTDRPALIIVDDAGSGRAELPASAAFRAALIPCILLTSRGDPLDVRARQEWAAVLPKPFRFNELIRLIESIRMLIDGEATDGPDLPGESNVN